MTVAKRVGVLETAQREAWRLAWGSIARAWDSLTRAEFDAAISYEDGQVAMTHELERLLARTEFMSLEPVLSQALEAWSAFHCEPAVLDAIKHDPSHPAGPPPRRLEVSVSQQFMRAAARLEMIAPSSLNPDRMRIFPLTLRCYGKLARGCAGLEPDVIFTPPVRGNSRWPER